MQILVKAPYLSGDEAKLLVRSTQLALDELNDSPYHHLHLRLAENVTSSNLDTFHPWDSELKTGRVVGSSDEEALIIELNSQEHLLTPTAVLSSFPSILSISYAPAHAIPASASSSVLGDFIASNLQRLFKEEQVTITSILYSDQPPTEMHPTSSDPQQVVIQSSSLSDSDCLVASCLTHSGTSRSLKYAPMYHVTISLFTPNSYPASWEIESALEEYIHPLLELLMPISRFSIETQVQLHAGISPSVQEPKYDAESGVWKLRREDLSGFVNAAEWPLSPSIGAGLTLHFIVYVPNQKQSPLVVEGSNASSWLIPQWGGVAILNLPSANSHIAEASSGLTKEAIQPALFVFSQQLLSLLGVPQSPPSLQLQIQSLVRVHAVSLLLSASSTMGSLARLTVALPSIAIPKSVSTAVDTTLVHLHRTCSDLREGRFQMALEQAKVAEAQAEKGFFEKSMVGQVYFPDEHKVAVYLPLLGPVGVPLVMAGLKELKRLWALTI